MKKVFSLSVLICLFQIQLLFSQTKKEVSSKPRLIVGIVVDQMRNDYIQRFWSRFGNGGFKRLVNEGYYFRNTHYNYIPTYTGPGHCSIYTGTTPRTHGIIGNEWYVKKNNTAAYCTWDTLVKTVGSTSKNGLASPKNQLSSTIGDELKMTSPRSKVFAVALKDRSAIFPAGHAANGALWFDDVSGGFISSTWYMNDLPVWVKEFNSQNLTKTYLEKGWEPLYPIATYTGSLADDNNYESAQGKEKPVFPYDYKSFLNKNSFGIIKGTPYGNSITKDLAIACIISEQLGKDDEADLLSISFSSPDIVAHSYGPHAIEVEDIYLRLDKDLEELFNILDKEVGKNNYSVFLTADHGAADVPSQLMDNKIPAGYMNEKKLAKNIKEFFRTNYGDTLLLANLSNEQVFINESKLYEMKLDKEEVERRLCRFLIGINGIAEAYSSSLLKEDTFDKHDYRTLLQNGYNHKLSGNVAFIYQPGWMDYSEKGTTHGTGYNYDTHVPLMFFGNGIKKGENFSYVTITQIAPSVSELLKINQPNSTTAEPLNDFFK
jgi:predicted AlkP superfamily pyrophosphatase or phosphodiesterase